MHFSNLHLRLTQEQTQIFVELLPVPLQIAKAEDDFSQYHKKENNYESWELLSAVFEAHPFDLEHIIVDELGKISILL